MIINTNDIVFYCKLRKEGVDMTSQRQLEEANYVHRGDDGRYIQGLVVMTLNY